MKFRRRTYATERVIWVVAFATMTTALLQGIDAQMQGSWPRFWLWIVGAAWIGAAAGWAETVKRQAGD